MDVDRQEVIITVTRNQHSLTPLAVEELTTLQDLRFVIDKLTSLDKARLLYINEEGNAAALESDDEFTVAVEQANKTKQLHLLIEDIKKQPKERCHHHHGHHDHHHHGHGHHGHSHKRHYSQLAACIGEKRKRAAEYAAKALLGKSQSMDASEEPEWFKEAMKKYTQAIIAEVKGQAGPEEEGSARKKECSPDKVTHKDIICDYCEKEIVGIRYKCGNCLDFDLCENCESFSEFFHDETHVFIKIRKPVRYAGVNKKGKMKPLLKRNIYKDKCVVIDMQQGSSSLVVIEQQLGQHQQKPKDELFIIGDDPLVVPSEMVSPPPTLPVKQDEESVKMKKPAPSLIKRSKKQLREDLKKTTREEPLNINSQEDMIRYSKKQLRELKAARQKRRKEQGELQAAGNGPVMMESLESSSSIQKGHGKCLDSKFVVDGNIPDGSVIMYGKAFSKSWIIQNTGTKTWRNVQLVHQDGFLPIQREVDVPDLAPGQQENVSVDYPAISPEDGSSIKSSWRLVHNKTTPFGCTLWLSCQLKPDPIDELTLSFEQIKYPVFEEEEEEEEEEEDEEEETQQHQGDNTSESSYSFVDPPSPPVLSYQSCRDDDEDCSDDDCSDDEFVVVIPDCFKLDKPLEGFTPDGTTPVTEDPPPVQLQQEQEQPSLSPTPSPPPTSPPPPLFPPVVSQPGKSPQTSPKPIPKREGDTFVPDRIKFSDAWMSRSRNPLTYAVGLINTVTDLAEQHIPTVSPKTTPSAPPPPEDEDSTASSDISKLIHQEPDTSRFIKQKWDEPKPATPMEELISMGFANRAVNSRLLKKHGNDVQLVINELLETNGEGYHDVISCSFS